MFAKSVTALTALLLVAGCKAEDRSGSAKGNNSVVQSAETRTAAGPLSREQALAHMKERHEHMESLGDATKAVNSQLKSSTPDLAVIRKSADTIARLAPDLQSWFPDGTGPDVGKTRAKAEIWQKPEDFALKAGDFRQAAQEFQVAAQSGDLDRIRSEFADLGKSCKGCHELYRAPKKD